LNLNKVFYLKYKKKSKLMVLTEKGLGDAIQEYIEKDERDAISELINFQIEKIQVDIFKYLSLDLLFIV
jgi:double-strand break repair protein MRE11